MPALLSRLAEIEAKAHDRSTNVIGRDEPRQLFLPGLNEFFRAMPNHLARSSLFAPVARGPKRIHKGTVLVSRIDATITYWDEQLDESQADVWMQAMHAALAKPLGEPVRLNRAEFLRMLGRHTGQYEYAWLHRSMRALTFAMLVVETTSQGQPKLHVGKTRALHLVDGYDYDDTAQAYTLRIDPRWRDMYSNREFALIDWVKRRRFAVHQDMAKALQRLIATSRDCTQRHDLTWLKLKLEYGGRMRDFVVALKRAMRELERLEIIAGGQVELSKKGTPQSAWTKL